MKPSENTNCPLHNTQTCAVMHMRACKRCPVPEAGVVSRDLVEDVALFSSLLPQEGIAHLFESEKCTLCKTNPNAADGFAIYDMAHSEPKRLQRKSLFSAQGKTGFMVPLQFACCKRCRSRLLWQEYLPMIGSILGVGLGVLLTLSEELSMQWRASFAALPLVLVAGGLAAGFGIAHLVRFLLRRRWAKRMHLDVRTHPIVHAMKALGWFSVFGGRSGKVVLTKRRIAQGLGTAGTVALHADFSPEPDFDTFENNQE